MKIYLLIKKNIGLSLFLPNTRQLYRKKLFEFNINIKDIEINLLLFQKSAKIFTFLVCLRDKKNSPEIVYDIKGPINQVEKKV